MAEQELLYLKEKLIGQRQDIFDRLRRLESDRQALQEREIEWEEEAQKADLTTLLNQLDGRKKEELEEIDQALTKMAAATYGVCESCAKPIPLKRLEALPASRWCSGCARKAEKPMR